MAVEVKRRCSGPSVNGYVLGITLFVTLAAVSTGVVFGSTTGVLEMEGFKDTFRNLYNDTNEMSQSNLSCSGGNGTGSDLLIGLIVSILGGAAVIGSLVAGWLTDKFSRKYSLAVSGLVLVVGSAIFSSAFCVWMLLAGRFLLGFSIGVMYVVMPVYISEVSPKEHRGMLASIIGPAYTGGVLAALCLNIGFAKFPLGWRVAFMISALLGLIYAVGMIFMPHTPRWLMKKGRDKEALAVLARINSHVSSETSNFVDTCCELKELQAMTTADSETTYAFLFKEVFRWKYRVLFIVIVYFLDANGGASVFYYTTTIFCKVGIDPFYSSFIFGLVILAASLVLTVLIDKIGRKTLFLLSILVQIVLGLATAILLQLGLHGDVVGYTVVVLISLFMFGNAASWLTLPWVITSEIFPINTKGATVAISSGSYWTFSAISNQLTPIIVGSSLQLHGYFYIITGVNVVGFFFILLLLPETKGVSLEEMNELFSQSIWQRFIGYFRCNLKGSLAVDPWEHNLQELERKDSCAEKMDSYSDIKCEMNADL